MSSAAACCAPAPCGDCAGESGDVAGSAGLAAGPSSRRLPMASTNRSSGASGAPSSAATATRVRTCVAEGKNSGSRAMASAKAAAAPSQSPTERVASSSELRSCDVLRAAAIGFTNSASRCAASSRRRSSAARDRAGPSAAVASALLAPAGKMDGTAARWSGGRAVRVFRMRDCRDAGMCIDRPRTCSSDGGPARAIALRHSIRQ
mmetsp:Transcript_20420/g.63477  ORF Transcript_20420/g.63477 Transcript_20420/m.63477 type:complete len:205 (-) Transcript_20420:18-632(-)